MDSTVVTLMDTEIKLSQLPNSAAIYGANLHEVKNNGHEEQKLAWYVGSPSQRKLFRANMFDLAIAVPHGKLRNAEAIIQKGNISRSK